MDEISSSFDESALSEEDLAVLRAFEAKQEWPGGPSSTTTPLTTQQTELQGGPDEELHALFLTEVTEDITAMRHALSHLEQEDHIDPADFAELQRLGHKVRGTAGAVASDNIAAVAHFVEVLAEQTAEGMIFPVLGVHALSQIVRVLETALQNLATHGHEGELPLAELREVFNNCQIDIEQLLAREQATAPGSLTILEADPACAFSLSGQEQQASPYVRIATERIEHLVQFSELAEQLRVALESSQEQVDLALQDLCTSQARLRQMLPSLSSFSHRQSTQPADEHSSPSLVARILRRETPYRLKAHSRLFKASAQGDEPDLEQYDEQDLLVLSLKEAIMSILLASSRMDTALASMNRHLQEYTAQVAKMRNAALLLRLVPLKLLAMHVQQAIELSAQESGLPVHFEMTGQETEVDQHVIETLAHPLAQLLQLCLTDNTSASQEAQTSQGLQAAIADPCHAWFHARGIGNEITLELGFSFSVSDGLLEVIREPVRQLQGTCTLQQNATGGMSLFLRFPRSHGSAQCLLVRAGNQYLLIPFLQVRRIGDSRQEKTDLCYDLHGLLGFPAQPQPPLIHPLLVLAQGVDSDRTVGVRVDEVIGEVELIVRPLVPYLQRPGIAGAASDGKGHVLLLLDLPELVRHHMLQEQKSSASPDAVEESQNRPLRALVADDSTTIRQALSQMLQHEHFIVEEARDGLEALEKLLEAPPDVLFLDVEMPRLNGYHLLDRLKQYPKLAAVKIVMLTSRSSDKHMQRAQELGAHAYLTKPCSQDQLLETIQRILRR
ncbi:MAG: response regulator [Ktedonobacteraceae bacterium]|nr:response regulator [Ktedonobacteraceae bacterium]